ncbi:phytanoyl-CoA dioxygenase family protein [Pirellulales bacterium]|nr:phytanoyl-CoA dioxygenase family protein [Pirellulales bacterium]
MTQTIRRYSPVNDIQSARTHYLSEGFVQGPKLFSDSDLQRYNAAFDAVMQGEWDTGKPPRDEWWEDGDDPARKLRKIDQPHVSNRTLHDAICHSGIARWAASVSGAKKLRAFAVQLLHKPPGGDPSAQIGWHHDFRYWGPWFEPDTCEAFTIWIAMSDVYPDSGPMCFVRGSHRWELDFGGDFNDQLDGNERERYGIPEDAEWDEVPDVMPAGAFSLHHQFLFHGSRPNTSDSARRSLAIHVCTDRAIPKPGVHAEYDYAAKMSDPWECPTIYCEDSFDHEYFKNRA